MPYYMGDYAGDPGFFGFLKKAVGLIPGVGTVASSIGSVFSRGGARRLPEAVEAGGGAIMRMPGGSIIKRGAAALGRLPLGAKVLGVGAAAAATGAIAERMASGGQLPRGFRISRKTGKVVRIRRMRVTNPRALRRAIRRAHGFARLARRVLRFTSPRAPKGRPLFKKHRRRAA